MILTFSRFLAISTNFLIVKEFPLSTIVIISLLIKVLNKPLILRLLFIDLLWGIVSESRDVQIRELKAEASAYSKLGEYKKAKKSILRAIDLDPSSKHLTHELAKISLKSKNFTALALVKITPP